MLPEPHAAHEQQRVAQPRAQRVGGLVLERERVDQVPALADAHSAEALEVTRHGGLCDVHALVGQELDELGLGRDRAAVEQGRDQLSAIRHDA